MSKPAKKKKSKKSADTRHFLTDVGHPAGKPFCSALLASGEFKGQLLKKIVPGKEQKAKRVELVVEAILSDASLMDKLISDYCEDSRQWLLVMYKDNKGPLLTTKNMSSSHEFFTNGKSIGWHGPFGHNTAEKAWYVHVHRVANWLHIAEGEAPVESFIRWAVIAEVTKEYVAFHWNGFSHKEDETESAYKQFGYWLHIGDIITSLRASFGMPTWKYLELHTLVLHKLIPVYDDDSGRWHHKKIRAQKGSVAINTSGARVEKGKHIMVDEDSGVRRLTREFAKAAIRALGASSQNMEGKVEREIFMTLLMDMGLKSYEFELDGETDEDDDSDTRMYCYFGTESESGGKYKGPDSIPHVHCFQGKGGSKAALKFIVEHDSQEI
ncbi:hypothetical protein EON64_10520 [archaeon]|nr:MAG: hypothetical protein EON64_10520 [archaeon]